MSTKNYLSKILSHTKHSLKQATKKLKQLTLVVTSFVMLLTSSAYANEPAALELLKLDNHFAMMRHAIAPGMGDPHNFNLTNCATQRNLSQDGIYQAVDTGDLFRKSGISEAKIYTSQWCRCKDTATNLDLGTPEELILINSFFENRVDASEQTLALHSWLMKQDLSKPTVLITHQVNITALTGVYPASGEIIILKLEDDASVTVVDRVQSE